MSMPGGFGGLVRFDEEYKSRFIMNPSALIVFFVLIIIFRLVPKIFWPVTRPVA